MIRLVIWMVVVLVLVQVSLAIGVARPMFTDNTWAIDADEDETILFQLQNGELSSKTVLFKVSIQTPAEIIDSEDQEFQQQYVLEAGDFQEVPITFNAPDGIYRVDYSYAESNAGGGAVSFSSFISDSFLVKAGAGSISYVLGISMDYGDFELSTSATNIMFIDDLRIEGDYITIDFRGETVDLTGFDGSGIVFGQKKVSLNFSGLTDVPAKIIFEGINSPYSILRNGELCPTSICSVQSYVSKRLTVSVTGFSTYEVVDEEESSSPGSSSSSSSVPSVSPPVSPPVPQSETPDIQSEETRVPSDVARPRVNQPSQTSSTGSAGTQSSSSNQAVDESPIYAVPPTTTDKKKMIVGVFAAIGLANLILAMVLFREKKEGEK